MSELTEEAIAEIRHRRVATLLGVWEAVQAKANIGNVKMASPLLIEAVEHYLMDLRILRIRYNIKDRIQLHKIAGLMTCAIMRFRPIIPATEEFSNLADMYANETFAIIHGVAICGEYTAIDGRLEVFEEPWFERWYKSFRYLLHYRNYTSESIIFAFETLACLRFPRNFEILDL